MYRVARSISAFILAITVILCLSSTAKGEDCANCARMPATYAFSDTVLSIQETDPDVYLIFFSGQHLPYSCALAACSTAETGDELWGGAHLEGETGVINWVHIVEPD